MFNVIRKQNGIATVIATVLSKDDAQKIMLENAQLSDPEITNELVLVKNDDSISQYCKTTKDRETNWVTKWILPNQITTTELVVEYIIVEADYLVIEDEQPFIQLLVSLNEDGSSKVGLLTDEIKYFTDKTELRHIIHDICQTNNLDFTKYNKILNEIDIQENENVRMALALVKLISRDRVYDYLHWKQLGYILHNVDDCLFDCYINFCKENDKYFNDEKCIEIWKSQNRNIYDIQLLHRWAKKDDPFGYAQLMKSFK